MRVIPENRNERPRKCCPKCNSIQIKKAPKTKTKTHGMYICERCKKLFSKPKTIMVADTGALPIGLIKHEKTEAQHID